MSGFGDVSFGNPSAVDTTASFSAAGTYVLRLTASRRPGHGADEVTVTVRPPPAAARRPRWRPRSPAGPTTPSRALPAGCDLASSDLELVTDGTKVQRVGLRFGNLQVPAGATITRAWIQFQTDEVSTDAAALTLRAEAADNAPTYHRHQQQRQQPAA